MHKRENEVFDAEEFEKNVPDGIQDHYWHQARNRIVLRALQRIDGARGEPVLEIGCGRGVVVKFLRERGWDITGCELGTPAPITAEVAPYLVFGQPAAELPRAQRESIKTILLLDVLEHIGEPAGFLRQQLEDFPNCTRFVITLPARQELYSNYDRFYGHYLRYDVETLGQMCDAAGLDLLEHRYFFHALYAPTALMTRLGVKRSIDASAPTGALRLLHLGLGLCFAGESRLLPGAVPGTSLLAVLSAPETR